MHTNILTSTAVGASLLASMLLLPGCGSKSDGGFPILPPSAPASSPAAPSVSGQWSGTYAVVEPAVATQRIRAAALNALAVTMDGSFAAAAAPVTPAVNFRLSLTQDDKGGITGSYDDNLGFTGSATGTKTSDDYSFQINFDDTTTGLDDSRRTGSLFIRRAQLRSGELVGEVEEGFQERRRNGDGTESISDRRRRGDCRLGDRRDDSQDDQSSSSNDFSDDRGKMVGRWKLPTGSLSGTGVAFDGETLVLKLERSAPTAAWQYTVYALSAAGAETILPLSSWKWQVPAPGVPELTITVRGSGVARTYESIDVRKRQTQAICTVTYDSTGDGTIGTGDASRRVVLLHE
jgi:hypothetical protein